MKILGKILDPKDITNKEYVDSRCAELEDNKVSNTDIVEYSSEEVTQLWNAIFEVDTTPAEEPSSEST